MSLLNLTSRLSRFSTSSMHPSILLRSFSTTRTRWSSEHPIGVAASVRAKSDPSFVPRPTLLQKEFDLTGRVAVISGANRGLGLEMAQGLAEAGAIVHCFDLPARPGETWEAAAEYVERIGHPTARLEYKSLDVTEQIAVWNAIEAIADSQEKRLDVCVAAAGVIQGENCLDYTASEFSKVLDVNANGAFYFAQASARQMVKQDRGGSIILVSSAAASVATEGAPAIAYCTSKSAVLQVARCMACELGPNRIRVNSLSPGYIRTDMTSPFLNAHPGLEAVWSKQNPLGRLGRPDEMRGAVAWLASDASTYCTGSDILICGGHTSW